MRSLASDKGACIYNENVQRWNWRKLNSTLFTRISNKEDAVHEHSFLIKFTPSLISSSGLCLGISLRDVKNKDIWRIMKVSFSLQDYQTKKKQYAHWRGDSRWIKRFLNVDHVSVNEAQRRGRGWRLLHSRSSFRGASFLAVWFLYLPSPETRWRVVTHSQSMCSMLWSSSLQSLHVGSLIPIL